jgi:hypothetical protein
MMAHGEITVMAKNDFKPFATAANANVMSRLTGKDFRPCSLVLLQVRRPAQETRQSGRPVLSRQRWRSTPTKVGWMCWMMLFERVHYQNDRVR